MLLLVPKSLIPSQNGSWRRVSYERVQAICPFLCVPRIFLAHNDKTCIIRRIQRAYLISSIKCEFLRGDYEVSLTSFILQAKMNLLNICHIEFLVLPFTQKLDRAGSG